MSLTFLTGGARSGKSSLAVRRALEWSATTPPGRLVYVATGSAGDEEMHRRIATHQRDRDPRWVTIEAPLDLVAGVQEALTMGPCRFVVVDCLAFWVANRLMEVDTDTETTLCDWEGVERSLRNDVLTITELLGGEDTPAVIVSNEVGMGLVPDNALGRQFRDTLGRINADVAMRATDAFLVVAGRVLRLEKP